MKFYTETSKQVEQNDKTNKQKTPTQNRVI